MRRAGLAIAFAAAVVVAACGQGSKSARIIGNVHEPDATLVAGATVVVGGVSTTSQNDGGFQLRVGTGTKHVHAEAAAHFPTDADVPIAAGDNYVELILIPCSFGQTGCVDATPTPTPATTPTPPADANVFASYSGTNYPGSGGAPAWTGTAMNSLTGTTWGDGGSGGQSDAFTECFKSPVEDQGNALSGSDTSDMIDHCIVDWFRAGGATQPGYVDAVVELHVAGALWRIASPDAPGGPQTARCSIADGNCSFDYYEIDGFNNATKFASASAGVMDVVDGGFKSPQTVVVDNGAFTAPNFP